MQIMTNRRDFVSTCAMTMILLLCITGGPLPSAAGDLTLKGKRIAMVIGFIGYDTAELHEPKKTFEAAGATVHVVSTQTGQATSGGGVDTKVDITIQQLKALDYDAVVFVGGSGAGEYYQNTTAHSVAKEALKQDKILASICAASTILAKAGVLKGKRATGYHKDPIVQHGGHYASEFVVRDGNLITAVGPNVIKEFAQAIMEALKNG